MGPLTNCRSGQTGSHAALPCAAPFGRPRAVQTGFPAGCSGSGWARGSNDGKACVPVAGCPSLSSHQMVGPLTGETLCGSVGWPMCFRMRRTVEPSVTKAIDNPQVCRAVRTGERHRLVQTGQENGPETPGRRAPAPSPGKELNCPADQMGDSAPMSVWLPKKSCARSLLMAVTSRRN